MIRVAVGHFTGSVGSHSYAWEKRRDV